MSEDEMAEKLAQLVGGSAVPDEKQNVHTFLHNVAVSEDTTKTGYLRDDGDINELGVPAVPMRTLKELELFCRSVANMGYYAEYFRNKAEILTSTSLSRNAKLLDLAVVQRREVADVTKRRKPNKGWFKKKEDKEDEQAAYT